MSDSSVFLLFLVVPILWALAWLLEDAMNKARTATVVGVICVAGMLLLIAWMVVALRQGSAGP